MHAQTGGALYGESDCDAVWAVVGRGSSNCSGCDWEFETELAYDSGASTMLTPGVCTYLAADGAGSVQHLGRTMDFYAIGPRRAYYTYTPYVVDRPITWYAYPGYSYETEEYRRVMDLTVTADSAGMLTIYGYSYLYFSI